MEIKFYLATPDKEVSSIRLAVSFDGKRYRRNIGVSVCTARWKKPKNGIQTSTDPKISAMLKGIRLNIESKADRRLTPEQMERVIDWAIALCTSPKVLPDPLSGKTAGKNRPTFWEFFKEWSERTRPNGKNHKSAYNRIADYMGKKDDWEDIDTSWYARLVAKLDADGYSVNYKANFIKFIKCIMNEGFALKYHTNTDYRLFRKIQEQADSVYLTQNEIDALWELELDSSMERKARDLFIIGVYTAARFSDYSRLSMDDIHDGLINFVQQKTSASVIVPAAPRVLEILQRNGGRAPALSQAKLNSTIKEVCRKAGITGLVKVTKSKGAAHITETAQKYTLVSSHTARRTGATLLYMSGVPLRQCMLITGHTTELNFMKYIRVTKEQNAMLLASNPFFNQR